MSQKIITKFHCFSFRSFLNEYFSVRSFAHFLRFIIWTWFTCKHHAILIQ